jgi:hypothetical protein
MVGDVIFQSGCTKEHFHYQYIRVKLAIARFWIVPNMWVCMVSDYGVTNMAEPFFHLIWGFFTCVRILIAC